MSTAEKSDADLLQLAYPYALDAVTDLDRGRIERQRHSSDRRTAAQFDATVADLREILADLTVVDSVRPPASVENRLMRALDRAVQASGVRRLDMPGGRTFGRLTRLDWLAAAAVLLIVIGAGVVTLAKGDGGREPATTITAAMIDQQSDMRARAIAVSSGGTLEIHSSASLAAATVTFRDVPAPPAGSSYQMWLVPLGGTPRSAVVLHSVPERPLVTGFQFVDTLAITVEPAGGSPQPTTTPIASANLT